MLDYFAGRRHNVLAICRCAHRHVASGPLIVNWLIVHRWLRALEAVPLHFRCLACVKRGCAELRAIAGHEPLSLFTTLHADRAHTVPWFQGQALQPWCSVI